MFCKLRRNFGFFCSVNHISRPLREHMFTSWKGHGLGFVISGCRSVCLFRVSRFNLLLCNRPVSGNNRLVKIASQIFLLFLIFVTSKNKATSPSFLRQKSTDHLNSLEVIFSQAGITRCIVIFINPAFTKMIDGTEKPKTPLKFAIRAARNNEFRCNPWSPWKQFA